MKERQKRVSLLHRRTIGERLTKTELFCLGSPPAREGGDIKAIKEDVGGIKDRLDRLETQSDEHITLLNEHTGRFDHVEALLAQILARLPEQQ
jgi:hypothetical protein